MPTCSRPGCGQDALVQWQRRSVETPEHTDAVYGCHDDAISLDLAAHVHAADCTAPDAAHLPGCDCTVEPLPEPEPDPVHVTLPTGWTIPTTPPENIP